MTDRDTLSGKPERVPPVISDSLRKPLAKRFYKDVGVGDTAPYAVLLDGRRIKTPKKRPLDLPARALAEAIADEWRAQSALIDPACMPLTRLANTAIDAVSDAQDAVAADIVAYAGNDLLCYRAETPEDLVRLQDEHWNPLLAWADDVLGVKFRVTAGVVHVAQPEAALQAMARALEPHEAFRLTGLHVLTTLTGSALIALALARGALRSDGAWKAAHVDEDYQISLWGEDFEAAERRRHRRAEFDAACRLLSLIGS